MKKNHENMYIGMHAFLLPTLQYGLVWHFRCFCTLCHMRTWYYLYGTLRKGRRPLLARTAPSHEG